MIDLIPPGLVQGIALWAIAVLTFIHYHRKAPR